MSGRYLFSSGIRSVLPPWFCPGNAFLFVSGPLPAAVFPPLSGDAWEACVISGHPARRDVAGPCVRYVGPMRLPGAIRFRGGTDCLRPARKKFHTRCRLRCSGPVRNRGEIRPGSSDLPSGCARSGSPCRTVSRMCSLRETRLTVLTISRYIRDWSLS